MGFNFYQSAIVENGDKSVYGDGRGRFLQSGDSFVVYPASDGVWDSLRLEVFSDGIEDYRALKTLEKKRGREFVVGLLKAEGMNGYKMYRRDANRHFDFREKINAFIEKYATGDKK